MKSITRNILTLLAPLAFLAMGTTAHATTYTTSASSDDLFIGFHQTGNGSDYLVDIGQASTFTSSKTLSLGSIALDLAAVFGSGWASDSTISWGVAGTTYLTAVGSDPAKTVYVSKQGSGSGVTAWNTASSTALGTPAARISGMSDAYNGQTSTIHSSVGIIQNNVATKAYNAYASYQPGGPNTTSSYSFAYFNPTIEASNASGITSSSAVLTLFRLAPGASAPGTIVGTFSINSSGTVTFTAAATSAFNTWATSYGLSGASALPTANPSGDGIENMVKFVLGANPNAHSATLPSGVISGSNYVVSFPFNSASTTEYTATMQYSTDLVTWTTATGGSLSSGTYTYSIPRGSATKFFTRLHVTSN